MALGLLIALTSPALAQTETPKIDLDTAGLVVDFSAGWDGYVDQSGPIPLSFLFHNHSERIVEGQLCLSRNSLDGPGVPLEDIVIAPGTTRRFTAIQALDDRYDYRFFVLLKSGNTVLWRRELDVSAGISFDPNYNYAFFIHETHSLPLAGGPEPNPGQQPITPGEDGRPVRCLTVKPFEVPQHPGPLGIAQAIIFADTAQVDELNTAQWQAVASWLCQGGAVFAHAQSQELIECLVNAAPLGAEPPAKTDNFAVRRVGLGAIYEYPTPLFSSGGVDVRNLIEDTTAKLPLAYSSVAQFDRYSPGSEREANINRILVVAFFAIYGLCVGLLVLFRGNRRRVAVFTGVIVAAASVLAGVLGGYLRASSGDLTWTTITQIGAGGAVQFGRVDVQSAGGRDKRVAVTGRHPDLQLVQYSRGNYYYSYYYRRDGGQRQRSWYLPFTWQRSAARGLDDVYQVDVPITAWGSRQLQAMAFNPDLRRLGFELAFEKADSTAAVVDGSEQLQPAGPAWTAYPRAFPGQPRGVFSLKLVNPLPFKIAEGWLVIAVTTGSAQNNTLDDVYQLYSLPGLAPGATYETTFAAGFNPVDDNRDRGEWWHNQWIAAPRLACLGEASAWIICRVEQSPELAIDGDHSDFVPRDELHLLVQQILPEDMPDPALFRQDAGTASEGTTVKDSPVAGGSDGN